MYLVPVAEAARLAYVPKRTLYLWIKEQRLTCTNGTSKSDPLIVDFDEVCALKELRGVANRLPRLDQTAVPALSS